MSKKKVTVYIAYAIVVGVKKYIADISRKSNNGILVAGYTTNNQEAHQWVDEPAVIKAIKSIYNPFERVFEYESIEVEEGRRARFPIEREAD